MTAHVRERERLQKKAVRSLLRDVTIPPCDDRRRRAKLEADDAQWLRWYFSTDSGSNDPFWYPFTIQQRRMIEAIRTAIVYGGDQALAASRGEGKTTLFERMLLKYTLSGAINFSVLFAATGSAAADSLDSIKLAIEENECLLADYPEVCVPVRALENTPNRAHYQTVTGSWHTDGRRKYANHPSKFSWCGQEITFPNVPGSPSAGAVIATRGLDSAVRGLKKKGKRPQVAGIDDPDTEETARSEEQAKKLEDRIDKAIGGLGGQQRGIARVMLTTLQNRKCVSYRFTDPSQKPTWKGQRFRFLVKLPDRVDLWDEYIQIRSAAQETFAHGEGTDEFGREAHAFYLARRAEMDAGSEVANPNRYDGQILPDGSQLEVSALQRYYNEVAKVGQEAVSSEYDNDPPEESGPIESGITAYRVQRQVSGYPRRVVPPGCVVLTQGIDVRKVALHWVVRAWRSGGTGYTLDYGVHEVRGTTRGTDDGVDVALQRAIVERMDDYNSDPYVGLNGETYDSYTLIDSGWRTQAVYAACKEVGRECVPAMGFGKSSGCVQANFTEHQRRTVDRKPGDGWFLSRRGKVWLCCMDADRWKSWEHDRWMTAPEKPGAMTVFGEGSGVKKLSFDEQHHFSYAKHICAEVEVEEIVRGSLKRMWKVKGNNNHYLDASYMANVAANMKGIRLLSEQAAQAIADASGARPTLEDLARRE